MSKKIIFALLLALAMVIAMVPGFAEEEQTVTCGFGAHQYMKCTTCDKKPSGVTCEVYTEATCTENRVWCHYCNDCGTLMNPVEPGVGSLILWIESGSALGHDWEYTSTLKAADCVNNVAGINKETCKICKETQWIRVDGHVFEDSLVPANCLENERVAEVCTLCGDEGETLEEMQNTALGHAYAYITVNPDDKSDKKWCAATCDEDGFGLEYCTRCDYVAKNADVIPATGHDWCDEDDAVYVEATCAHANGLEYTCSVCGATEIRPLDKEDEAYEAPLAHKAVPADIAATCVKPGVEGATICTVCEQIVTEGKVLPINPDAHEKVLVKTLKAATCTTPGIGSYDCALCKANQGYETIPAAHTWAEVTGSKVEPTCGKDGKVDVICIIEGCDGKDTLTLKATGKHNIVEDGYLAATCTDPEMVGEICSVCGYYAEGKADPAPESEALGHDWKYVTVNPDKSEGAEKWYAPECGKTGYGSKYCARCGEKVETAAEIPALEHDWPEDGEYIAAGCDNAAGIEYICTLCGDSKIDEFEEGHELYEAAKGHGATVSDDVKATCIAGGVEGREVCTICGKTVVPGNETPKDTSDKGHKEVLVKTLKEATCESTGIGKYECELCEVDLGYKTIDITHMWVEVTETRVEATCGKDGKVEYFCALCEEEKEETLKATGKHDMQDTYKEATCDKPARVGSICTICGAEGGNVTDVEDSEALGHAIAYITVNPDEKSKVEWYAATCTEDGFGLEYCTRCDYKAEEAAVIEATGHDWPTEDEGKWVDATCAYAGGVQVACKVCGATKVYEAKDDNDEFIDPALDHTESDPINVAVTCKTAGVTGKIICTVCEKVLNEGTTVPVVDDQNHVRKSVKTLKEATCTTSGIGKFVCELCDTDLGYLTIPADHTWVEVTGSRVEANCGVDGKVDYICAVEGCEGKKTEKLPATGKHDFEEGFIDPTCTEPGKAGEKCTVCGAAGKVEDMVDAYPATGHTYAYITVNPDAETESDKWVAPTCDKPGYGLKYCINCDVKDTVPGTIAALGCDWVKGGYVEATCAHGYGIEYTCSRCGETMVEEVKDADGKPVIPALDHQFGDDIKKLGNCTETGYMMNVCEVCGYEYIWDTYPVDPNYHVTDETVIKPATCESKGISKFVCTLCDYSEYKTTGEAHNWSEELVNSASTCLYKYCVDCGEIEIIKEFPGFEGFGACTEGHTIVVIPAVEATCTETGLTEGTKCSVCGEILVEQEETPVADHIYGEWVVEEEPTCVEAGVQVKYCECGEFETEEIPATGKHTEKVLPAVEATCTETGLTEGVICSVCEKVLVEQIETEATGHTFGEWVVELEPTCVEAGAQVKYCDCGEIEVEEIPATGKHEYVDGKCECGAVDPEYNAHEHDWLNAEKVVTAPTCTEKGFTTYTCECGETMVFEPVPALGHKEAILEAKVPTCTEAGLEDGVICAVCDAILLAQKEIPALGHTEKVTMGKDATCTEAGLTDGVVCTVCGETLATQEVIPALGHKEVVIPGKAATCTETGLTDGKACEVCGMGLVKQEVIPVVPHTEEVVKGYAATCEKTGLTDGKKCSVCGEIMEAQEEIAVLPHTEKIVKWTFNADITLKAAIWECSVCGTQGQGEWEEIIFE